MGGHDLGIGSRDVDSSIKAGSVMGFHNVSSVDFVGTNATVVGALRSGEAIFGPSKGMVVLIQKSVL